MYGNVVDWRTSEWELWNMTVIHNVSYNTICNSRTPGTTIFPTPRDMFSAIALCRKLKGRVTVVKDFSKMEQMSNMFMQHTSRCRGPGTNNAYWNGWWDLPKEKHFTDINNDTPLPSHFHPWYVQYIGTDLYPFTPPQFVPPTGSRGSPMARGLKTVAWSGPKMELGTTRSAPVPRVPFVTWTRDPSFGSEACPSLPSLTPDWLGPATWTRARASIASRATRTLNSFGTRMMERGPSSCIATLVSTPPMKGRVGWQNRRRCLNLDQVLLQIIPLAPATGRCTTTMA